MELESKSLEIESKVLSKDLELESKGSGCKNNKTKTT